MPPQPNPGQQATSDRSVDSTSPDTIREYLSGISLAELLGYWRSSVNGVIHTLAGEEILRRQKRRKERKKIEQPEPSTQPKPTTHEDRANERLAVYIANQKKKKLTPAPAPRGAKRKAPKHKKVISLHVQMKAMKVAQTRAKQVQNRSARGNGKPKLIPPSQQPSALVPTAKVVTKPPQPHAGNTTKTGVNGSSTKKQKPMKAAKRASRQRSGKAGSGCPAPSTLGNKPRSTVSQGVEGDWLEQFIAPEHQW